MLNGDTMFQRSVLGNQLRVVTSMMAHTQSVSIAIFIGAGSRYESPDLAGVSHFIEHLPFKGSEKWPTARDVSEAIEGVGGIMNASTDREVTVFWCKVARPHFRTALDVLLDMLMNPLLDPEEVEKEREVIQEELRMTYDNPSYRVDLLIDEAMWPDQAMGRDVGGTPDTVAAIDQETIREYMTRQYNPANAVVAVAGNIQHDEVVTLLQNATHDWKPQDSLDWEPVSENGATGPVVKIERRRSDQSHLCLALPGLSLNDPDRYALSLLNVMLGDGMSSRLFLNLREVQSLAYDVSSSINHFRDCGSMVVYCGVEPRKTNDAVRAVMQQLDGMRRGSRGTRTEQGPRVRPRAPAAPHGGQPRRGVVDGVAAAAPGPALPCRRNRGPPQRRNPRRHLQPGNAAVPRGATASGGGRPAGRPEDADWPAEAVTKTPSRLERELDEIDEPLLGGWNSTTLPQPAVRPRGAGIGGCGSGAPR